MLYCYPQYTIVGRSMVDWARGRGDRAAPARPVVNTTAWAGEPHNDLSASSRGILVEPVTDRKKTRAFGPVLLTKRLFCRIKKKPVSHFYVINDVAKSTGGPRARSLARQCQARGCWGGRGLAGSAPPDLVGRLGQGWWPGLSGRRLVPRLAPPPPPRLDCLPAPAPPSPSPGLAPCVPRRAARGGVGPCRDAPMAAKSITIRDVLVTVFEDDGALNWGAAEGCPRLRPADSVPCGWNTRAVVCSGRGARLRAIEAPEGAGRGLRD